MTSTGYDLDKLRKILEKYKYDVLEYHGLGYLRGKMDDETIIKELER